MRRAPMEAFEKRPLSGIPVGSALALKVGGDDQGFLIHFRKVELEQADRWGLCLVSAMRGHFAEAIAALQTSTPEENLGFRSSLSAGIQAVSELFQSVRLELQPAPTLRGTMESRALPDLAELLVRDGIRRAWPEGLSDSSGTTASDVQALVAAASGPPSGWLSDSSVPSGAGDSRLQEGYAAVRGWGFLLRGEPEDALGAFGSVRPAHEDPFDLQFGLAVARRLATGRAEARAGASEVSTEQIWSALFSRLVDSL